MLGIIFGRQLRLLLLLVFTVGQLSGCAGSKSYGNKERGLMLDMARYYYKPETVKRFIDTVAENGGTFIHLHFSDDENYALESTVLGQKAAEARLEDNGVYINRVTGKPFWSDGQLRQIADYALSRNIEIIPEIGSPGHMGGIFKILKASRGSGFVDNMQSDNGEIDINKPQNVTFMQNLMAETADKLGNSSRHFHIGGDEFGYGPENNHEFITYANKQAAFLADRGLKTRMWNDGIIKSSIDSLDHNIEITYWSYDGNPENKDESAKRRRIRASLPELLDKDFKVLNYNSYYLYVVPNAAKNWREDSVFSADDARKNWNLGVWDGKNHSNVLTDMQKQKVAGAAVAVWGEYAGNLGNEEMEQYARVLLQAVFEKTQEK